MVVRLESTLTGHLSASIISSANATHCASVSTERLYTLVPSGESYVLRHDGNKPTSTRPRCSAPPESIDHGFPDHSGNQPTHRCPRVARRVHIGIVEHRGTALAADLSGLIIASQC